MNTNDLINETSPYLLQHAHNPVQWHPWGDKALMLAKELDKPILVSIGYAACHWCHVMEKESFENEETAAFMNEHFVNIKIDREERPDLDHIYMDAVQAISGSGGWPLNVFLTPDARPFFGGTYYPPRAAFNRPSWLDVLQSMYDHWTNKRQEVFDQAEKLTEHLEKSNRIFFASTLDSSFNSDFFSLNKAHLIADNLLKNADTTDGGFGNPPKFLQTGSINYLLQLAHHSGQDNVADHAIFSLLKMIRGGIYDQVGGGISRYSTDKSWLVPHFEKMLYDNALLILSLCEAHSFKKNDELEQAIHATIQFVLRDLSNGSGAYYTALDADSEGVEGKYYVWQKSELEGLLGEDATLFCKYYNVSNEGNWEDNNILHVTQGIDEFASSNGLERNAVETRLQKCRVKVFEHRQGRIPPGLDDKVLLNNNALFISALCSSYACTGRKSYLEAAEKACLFIEKFLKNDEGALFHNVKNGRLGVPAFLDDYVFYIDSLVHLQEVTGNEAYLLKASEYLERVLTHFTDEAGLFCYYTDINQADVIVRKTELYDGAMPSSNAILAKVLKLLSGYFERPEWAERSAKMTAALMNAIEKYPGSFACWASNFLGEAAGFYELAIVGKNAPQLLEDVLRLYLPHRMIQSNTGENLNQFPLLNGKVAPGEDLIYLCRNYSCQAPVKNTVELLQLIENKRAFQSGSQYLK